MGMITETNKYKEKIEYEILELTQKLSNAPEGSIRINKNENHYKWYVRNADGSRKYIPKNKKEYAQKLALKAYYKKKLSELQKEKLIIEEFVDKMNDISRLSEKIIFESEEFGRLISEGLLSQKLVGKDYIEEWVKMDYAKNNKHPEQLNVKVRGDLYVRSKSEAFIAMELIKASIPFRYECELILDEVAYYPDFTIMNPVTGEIVLWEHFGMVDRMDYRKTMLSKLDTFIRNGYIPSVNMIITCESMDKPLDFENIRAQVEHFFG